MLVLRVAWHNETMDDQQVGSYMAFNDAKYLVKQTVEEWQEDNAARLAAALAYYTVFSLPPLLIIALAIAGWLYDDPQVAQEQLLRQASSLVGQDGAEAVAEILENAAGPDKGVLAVVIGVITLLLGASGVFAQLQETMNTIWEVQPRPGSGIIGTIKDRFFSFTMVLGVGFLLLVSLVLSAILAAMGEFISGWLPEAILLAQLINFIVSFAVTVVLIAMIYKIVPDVEVKWNDVWIGAFVTAALFTVGKWAIGFYLGRSAPASTYGAAGSLIIILLWIYYSAQILFIGAEFTQVYARRFGDRIRPAEGAVPISEETAAEESMPWQAQPGPRRRYPQDPSPPVSSSRPPNPARVRNTAPTFMLRFHGSLVTLLSLVWAAWRTLFHRHEGGSRGMHNA